MRYRELGNTGLRVSEIGLGAEWLERHNQEEVTAVIRRCEEQGINILDCWMSNPQVDSGSASPENEKSSSSFFLHSARRPHMEIIMDPMLARMHWLTRYATF